MMKSKNSSHRPKRSTYKSKAKKTSKTIKGRVDYLEKQIENLQSNLIFIMKSSYSVTNGPISERESDLIYAMNICHKCESPLSLFNTPNGYTVEICKNCKTKRVIE